MGNETEEILFEGVESETEGVGSYNEVVDNEVLPPEIIGYILSNTPGVNNNNKRATCISIVWNNLIVGSNELHSVENPISMLSMILILLSNQHHQPTSSPTRPS